MSGGLHSDFSCISETAMRQPTNVAGLLYAPTAVCTYSCVHLLLYALTAVCTYCCSSIWHRQDVKTFEIIFILRNWNACPYIVARFLKPGTIFFSVSFFIRIFNLHKRCIEAVWLEHGLICVWTCFINVETFITAPLF